MLRRPKLKGHVTLFPLSPTRWGVSGGGDELSRIELRNEQAIRAFTSLLPLLDGSRDADSVVVHLVAIGVSRAAAVALLGRLEQARLIEEADDHGLTPEEVARHAGQIRFFSRFTSAGGAKFQAALRRRRVVIVDGEAPDLAPSLAAALRHAGVGEVEVVAAEDAPPAAAEPPPEEMFAFHAGPAEAAPRAHRWRDALVRRRQAAPDGPDLNRPAKLANPADPAGLADPTDLADLTDLIVVAQQAHDPVLLEAMDDFTRQTRIPWLLVRCLSAQEGWVGPLFVPFDTASYRSLEARWQANLAHAEDHRALGDFVRAHGRAAAGGGGLAPTLEVLAGIAATEAVKFLSGYAVPQLAGRLLSLHFGTWATELHDVLRVPHLERPPAAGPLPFPWQDGEPLAASGPSAAAGPGGATPERGGA